ncbi:hypothetical protein SPRG_09396 [Saprolegnia parasitica CBS 223.65]|uniref:Uncharacterized protein n=1 Tax=Saprolegnia parasitica (strain CBS 223.65) TaxID=695850 RepID=A0A067C4J5_SAPPC|nr:hypothetical protein SPRG_09396 [Saprolegnia parasitica CBS 223.65]KDO25453.1 hypothetical protein SPRG_09396 [Saprolegnia parasitica CBS 223.65]|eukprot:XP_012203879.1 hypothetical protein SPRG_09396 [Saprolegnia parasitica CBS 223.65]
MTKPTPTTHDGQAASERKVDVGQHGELSLYMLQQQLDDAVAQVAAEDEALRAAASALREEQDAHTATKAAVAEQLQAVNNQLQVTADERDACSALLQAVTAALREKTEAIKAIAVKLQGAIDLHSSAAL